jgi:hypothetical protein
MTVLTAATGYLRPNAIKADVVLETGQRFGWHNPRHSLATFLVTETKADVRTVQGHATALQFLDHHRVVLVVFRRLASTGPGVRD